jgi:hypothetical protein
MSDLTAVFRAKQAGFLPDILGLDWVELRHGFGNHRRRVQIAVGRQMGFADFEPAVGRRGH